MGSGDIHYTSEVTVNIDTALGMMIVSTIAVLIGPARMAKQMPCK